MCRYALARRAAAIVSNNPTKVSPAPKQTGSKQKTTLTQESLTLAVPGELIEPLSLTGREIFEPPYNRAEMKLDKVLEAYGAWGEKSLYGKTVTGVIRSTVVIDARGVVEAGAADRIMPLPEIAAALQELVAHGTVGI